MKKILTFIVVTLIAFPAISQKKADLSYHLEMNKVYRAKATTVQQTTQTVMGNEQSVQTNSTSVISLKPLKQLEGELITEVRFDTIITIISQPAMEINSTRPGNLNSSDPGEILECILNRMSNSTFVVKMTNYGRVVQFMNLEPLVQGIMLGTDSISGQMADFILARAKTMLEEKSLTTMIESVTAFLPGKEIAVGEKWENTTTISGGGMDMTQRTDYTLEKLSKESADISGEMFIESVPGTMEMNGAQITPDLRGIGKVNLSIDPETGWVISGTFKNQISGEMSVNAQGNSLTIPVNINTDTEIVAVD